MKNRYNKLNKVNTTIKSFQCYRQIKQEHLHYWTTLKYSFNFIQRTTLYFQLRFSNFARTLHGIRFQSTQRNHLSTPAPRLTPSRRLSLQGKQHISLWQERRVATLGRYLFLRKKRQTRVSRSSLFREEASRSRAGKSSESQAASIPETRRARAFRQRRPRGPPVVVYSSG